MRMRPQYFNNSRPKMEPLKILTEITALHRVFDASGRLPFSIVFGLCRRSKEDNDARSLVLDVAGSILDVPYALANGFLSIHERDPQDKSNWIAVDLSLLTDVRKSKSKYISLSSPASRDGSYRSNMTEYQCHLGVDDFASILEPGRGYSIKLANDDLGVHSWAYHGPN